MSAPSSVPPAWRESWIGLGLVLFSIVSSLVVAELAVRALGTDSKRWEWRNFLTDPGVTEGRWRVLQPDPQLGYVPRPGYSGTDHGRKVLVTFDEHGLRAHRRAAPSPAGMSPPILVVGDSYAMGEEVHDDETVPAHLQEMLDHRVLNGGVLGYGLDQIVLRAEAMVERFRPGTLVVSFIADDVRRTRMRILWGLDKPYFDVVDGGLILRGVPVPPPVEAMKPIDHVRAVLGYSFLADVVMRRLDLDDYWLSGQPEHAKEAHDDGEAVSCLLMDRLRQLGRDQGADVLLVAQYTPHAWVRESTLRFESGIVDEVLACAQASGLRTLDTRNAFETAISEAGVDHYYINRHMTSAGNRLTAELIADQFRGGAWLLPSPPGKHKEADG